jgi:hypothetical protein
MPCPVLPRRLAESAFFFATHLAVPLLSAVPAFLNSARAIVRVSASYLGDVGDVLKELHIQNIVLDEVTTDLLLFFCIELRLVPCKVSLRALCAKLPGFSVFSPPYLDRKLLRILALPPKWSSELKIAGRPNSLLHRPVVRSNY